MRLSGACLTVLNHYPHRPWSEQKGKSPSTIPQLEMRRLDNIWNPPKEKKMPAFQSSLLEAETMCSESLKSHFTLPQCSSIPLPRASLPGLERFTLVVLQEGATHLLVSTYPGLIPNYCPQIAPQHSLPALSSSSQGDGI